MRGSLRVAVGFVLLVAALGVSAPPAQSVGSADPAKVELPAAIPDQLLTFAKGLAGNVRGDSVDAVSNLDLTVHREGATSAALEFADENGVYQVHITNADPDYYVVEVFDAADEMALTAYEVVRDAPGSFRVVAVPQHRVLPAATSTIAADDATVDLVNGFATPIAFCIHSTYAPWRTYTSSPKIWSTDTIHSCNQPGELSIHVRVEKWSTAFGWFWHNIKNGSTTGYSYSKSVSTSCYPIGTSYFWRTYGVAEVSWASGWDIDILAPESWLNCA